MFGGYPGADVDYATHRDVGLWDGDGPFPPTEASMPTPEHNNWGVTGLDPDDVFHVRLPGSGGYGDPLDRDPDAVATDVADGQIAPETARQVYHVPVDEDGTRTESATAAREAAYAERLESADHPESPVEADPTGSTPFRLGPHLDVARDGDGTPFAVCAECDETVGRADRDWKATAAVTESPLSTVGTGTHHTEGFCLREFVCPGCGTLLDTEVAKPEDPALVSRLAI